MSKRMNDEDNETGLERACSEHAVSMQEVSAFTALRGPDIGFHHSCGS